MALMARKTAANEPAPVTSPKRSERLRIGLSVAGVTRITGILESTVVAFERGEPAGCTSEQLDLLERAYGLMGALYAARDTVKS